MQKKSNNLLEAELKELGDDLIHTLYSLTKDCLDGNHTCLTLYDLGLIDFNKLRNHSICRDFHLMIKNPTVEYMSHYHTLSAKYDLSLTQIRRIIRDDYNK